MGIISEMFKFNFLCKWNRHDDKAPTQPTVNKRSCNPDTVIARCTSGDAGVKLWKKSEHFALPVGSAVCNSESMSHHLKTSCFLFSCLRKMGKKFWSFPIHACNYDKNCKRIIIFLRFPILCWLNPVVNAIMIWICMPFLEIFF